MTVTLLTVQTLTGSGTAITTLLPYPHPQSPQYLIGSARIIEVVWAVRESSCSICSILATPLVCAKHSLRWRDLVESGCVLETVRYVVDNKTKSCVCRDSKARSKPEHGLHQYWSYERLHCSGGTVMEQLI